MIIEQLRQFGLSDKETKVYLSLLGMGSSSVQEISKVSELNRGTSYVVLESLLRQGLVNRVEKSGTRVYAPTPPELLLEKTTQLIDKHVVIEKDIASILPDLQSLSKSLKRHPRVLFFEGIEGIKSIYESIFTSKKDITVRIFSQPVLWESLQLGYYAKIFKKMSDSGIKIKAIHLASTKRDLPKKSGVEILYIPENKYGFTSDLSIYENKVILISPQDQYGVIIENDDTAYTMKELFDLAWEEAKRINSL